MAVYQFSGILASGLTPAIASLLLGYAGGEPWLFVGYLILGTLISLAAIYFSPETYRRDVVQTTSPVQRPATATES